MTFADLGLPPALVAALAVDRITEPTPVQAEGIPRLLAGQDAWLRAGTGTGKTLAYLLPLYCRVDPALKAIQVLVLAPTHELAIQIRHVASGLARAAGLPIDAALLIGGVGTARQLEKLKTKPAIVVGSTDRILDLMRLGKLKLKGLKALVVDEADRMLGRDSLAAVRAIADAAPPGRQAVFASATVRPECAAEAAALAPGLAMVDAGAASVSRTIDHAYLVCEDRDKVETLRRLLNAVRPRRALVFVHRNDRAEEVAAKLAYHGIAVADLHGARDKLERKKAMDDFRSGRVQVLLASDLAARGLDIEGVSHVVNLDVPTESAAYLHRVGRTGRAGAGGHAFSLANPDETRLVRRWETELGIRLDRVRLREGRVVPDDAPPPDRRRPR